MEGLVQEEVSYKTREKNYFRPDEGQTNGFTDGQKDGQMDGQTDGQMDGQTDG